MFVFGWTGVVFTSEQTMGQCSRGTADVRGELCCVLSPPLDQIVFASRSALGCIQWHSSIPDCGAKGALSAPGLEQLEPNDDYTKLYYMPANHQGDYELCLRSGLSLDIC